MAVVTAPAPAQTKRAGSAKPGVRERIGRSWAKWWFAYAMLIPVAVVCGLLVFYPLAKGIWFAFTNADGTNTGIRATEGYDFVGLKNFVEVLSGERRTSTGESFYDVFVRTMVWTTTNVFFHFTIGLGLAILLNRPMRFRGVYRVLLLVPWAMPAYITASSWRFLFNTDSGPINAMLSVFGVEPISWLGGPISAMVAVIMVNVWLGIPFMMVALLGGLQAIPKELYEAADVDGATKLQQFWRITLPMLRPVASTVILLGFIWTFNMFVIIFLVTQGGPAGATQILVTFAYTAAFVEPTRQYAIASTYGVIILSLLLVFASAYQQYLKRQGESAWA